ncbi:MAG: GNAT family N-acetyltransferase [Chloroflexota bacterium]
MTPGYVLRPATPADAAVLAAQRRAMFEALGQVDGRAGTELEAATRRYIEQALPAGSYYAWLVEAGAAAVAGGGVQLRPLVPRPGYVHDDVEGLILSMWTEPGHRRRGLAAGVLEAILTWSETRGLRRLTLHASAMGRPLYTRYGFTSTNEMRFERDVNL